MRIAVASIVALVLLTGCLKKPGEHAPVTELHCAADRSSAAYRRYLRERRIGFGTC